MPQFRSYPEATSLIVNDAFVIDRIGQGTMFIEQQDTNSTFRVSMRSPPANPYSASPVRRLPYDHIDYDTTGGYSLTQSVPGFGTIPAFRVPITGYWRFETATQFHDNSTSDTVSILQGMSQLTATGATVEFYQFNSPLMTVNGTASSQTFSVGFSVQAFCTQGNFLFTNSDLESAATNANLQINASTATLVNTYFSGSYIR